MHGFCACMSVREPERSAMPAIRGMPYNSLRQGKSYGRSFGWGMGERRFAVAAQRLLPRRFPIGVQTFEQVVRDFEGYVARRRSSGT